MFVEHLILLLNIAFLNIIVGFGLFLLHLLKFFLEFIVLVLVISSFNDNNDVDHDAQQDEANHREAHYSFEVVTVICFRFADPVTEEEHVVAADKNDCFIVNFLSVH